MPKLMFLLLISESSNLEIVVAIIAAFLGSGVVTVIFEYFKERKQMSNEQNRLSNVRKMLLDEIKLNLHVVNSIKGHHWIRHQSYTTVFESMNTELGYFDKEEASKILDFYRMIEVLRARDQENDFIDENEKNGNYDRTEVLRYKLGRTKLEIRREIIKIGVKILGISEEELDSQGLQADIDEK